MIDVFLYIGSFLGFCLIQSLMINGLHHAFSGGCIEEINKGKICSGNALYKISPKFFESNKHKTWAQPIFSCVKCMASFWSVATFMPCVIYVWGFHWIELFFLFINICVLSSLNWFIYKML